MRKEYTLEQKITKKTQSEEVEYTKNILHWKSLGTTSIKMGKEKQKLTNQMLTNYCPEEKIEGLRISRLI